MINRSEAPKILWSIIVLLAVVLVGINIVYLKTLCTTRQCVVVNVATIALLIWAVLFLFSVLKYSKKDKK